VFAEGANRVAFGILCAVASLRAGGGFATRTPCASLRSAVPLGRRCRVAPSLRSAPWLGLSFGFLLGLGLSAGVVLPG